MSFAELAIYSRVMWRAQGHQDPVDDDESG
jgi:hypothetical protein